MQRLEATERGRVVISTAFILIVICVATTTLRPLGASGELTGAARPVVDFIGLRQGWGLFAPDPRREQYRLEVDVHYADGSTWRWTAPRGNPFTGPRRDYRWRRWAESVSLRHPALAAPTARWAARQGPRRDAVAATVVVRRAPVRDTDGRVGPWRARSVEVRL